MREQSWKKQFCNRKDDRSPTIKSNKNWSLPHISLPNKEDQRAQIEIFLFQRSDRSSHTTNLRTNLGRRTISATRGNAGIPPFRPIAPSGHDINKMNRLNRYNKLRDMEQQAVGVPAFAALPNSIAKLPSSLNPVNRRISVNISTYIFLP